MGKERLCIIKKPGEKYGILTKISDDLKSLQSAVGGYIEVIKVTENDMIVCNEEGKLIPLLPNMQISWDTILGVSKDILFGTIVVIGSEDGEFADLRMSFEDWKQMVDRWEN